jgi:hypothetical protein
MYAALRAAGKKPDLALVVCDTDAVSAGKSFRCAPIRVQVATLATITSFFLIKCIMSM